MKRLVSLALLAISYAGAFGLEFSEFDPTTIGSQYFSLTDGLSASFSAISFRLVITTRALRTCIRRRLV